CDSIGATRTGQEAQAPPPSQRAPAPRAVLATSASMGRHAPQPVPAPVRTMSSSTERAPSATARTMSRSVTARQRHTYMDGFRSSDFEYDIQNPPVKFGCARVPSGSLRARSFTRRYGRQPTSPVAPTPQPTPDETQEAVPWRRKSDRGVALGGI